MKRSLERDSVRVKGIKRKERCFRVFEPWDILRGKCIFRDKSSLESDLGEADLSHWAPNCATFSRAREIPIKGVINAPKPLRNESFPEGIPSEVSQMSKRSKRKLEDDSHMANLAADRCLDTHKRGKHFTLEHPARSLARHLPSWKRLLGTSGVKEFLYHTCMFEGSRRKKQQILICNSEKFSSMGLVCNGTRLCDRTGMPHLRWRPTVSGGKVVQFTTGDEREYPVGFCQSYAKCAAKLLGSNGKFVEVFSGPNAPLSRELSAELGEKLRGSKLKTDKGIRHELQRLADITGNQEDIPERPMKQMACSWEPHSPEFKANRVSMLEAGRQPSYGKRHQLIPDGLQSESEHLQAAMKLDHPFNSLVSLKEDHRKALEHQPLSETEANFARLKELAKWRSLSQSEDVSKLQCTHEDQASNNAKRLGRKPRTALMSMLGRMYGIEDDAVPSLCLSGMPIVGKALESPFFHEYKVPAAITVEELLRTAPRRRRDAIARVKYMAKLGSKLQAQTIYTKTIKEVTMGTMGGPFPHEDLVQRHGKFYNIIPSFGLEQGVNDKGEPKFRRIDDHTAGHTNLAATRMQKIEMAMVDYLVVMTRALHERFGSSLYIGTEDMQGAYRQIPLPDSQVAISITGVYNPNKDCVDLFEMYGQPFGAGHAVPNFYRLAEWACRLLCRAFSLVIDHFFDDFFYIDRPACCKVSMFCVQQAFSLLGLTLDPEKSQVPAEVSHVLGVAFNLQSLAREKVLGVEPKPLRVSNFLVLVDNILEKNCLPPSVAASLLGKFGFLCSTLFGKLGRFCTGAIRERQYSSSLQFDLTPLQTLSLRLMRHVVQIAPKRSCRFGSSLRPILLYTDASDVPDRDPRFGLGGVLIRQDPSFQVEFFSCSPSKTLVASWLPKENYMGQLEILAGPAALTTWGASLRGQQVIHFVDNDSAAANLVRGYSPKVDSSALVGEYWLTAAKFGIDIYIDRVESKSNLADGPSRFDWSSLKLYNARHVQAELPSPEVSLAFSLYGLSAARPLVQSQSDPLTALGRKEKSQSTT